MTEVDVATVWRLHDAVLAARHQARRWFAGANRRREARDAQHREEAALRRLGFDSFEVFAAAYPRPEPVAPFGHTLGAPGGALAAAHGGELAPRDGPAAPEERAAREEPGRPEAPPTRADVLRVQALHDHADEPDTVRRIAEVLAVLGVDPGDDPLRAAREFLATHPLPDAAPPAEPPTEPPTEPRVEAPTEVETTTEPAAEAAGMSEAESLRAALEATRDAVATLRAEIEAARDELRSLREVARADAEHLLHHAVGEAARMREEAQATAAAIVGQAETEADLIRREAAVTAQGIREIAREDARALREHAREAIAADAAPADLLDRIAKLERRLSKYVKTIEHDVTEARAEAARARRARTALLDALRQITADVEIERTRDPRGDRISD